MAGNEDIPINNGAVLNISQIVSAVMSSAAEAKLGALFINAKMAVSMQCTLKEMKHPQTCTPIQTKNSTAHALLTNKIMPKALKAMDMRFLWLCCRKAQDQYCFLLETWNTKFGGLLDQASSSQAPQIFLATNTNIFKEHGKQFFCQENLIDTSICGTIGSTTTNNCSQRRLMAQLQGCVRLAGRTS